MADIDEVDDIELEIPLGSMLCAFLLVQAIGVVELLCKGRPLVVVHNHCKAFGTVLTDERLDDGEGLTRARSADNPGASERVRDIDGALAELALIVVAHRDIDAILIVDDFLALLETLVLQVEAVFEQAFLQPLADVVKGDMDKDCAYD